MNWIRNFLSPETYSKNSDLGLLILRIGAGLMMITHGWPKFIGFNEKAESFYNFMGLGTEFSLALTVFAEVGCSFLLTIGLGTRFILIPLIILAMVIAFVIHGADPFGDKEHGLLFLVPYITLMLTGPGKYSIDHLLFPRSVRVPK